jgi:uncharacterized membrane protein YgdD (TMEM256/DUF423 family)
MWSLFLCIGSVGAGLAVALGAFGAHVLEARISADLMDTFQTGVRYHMLHAVALMIVALAADRPAAARLFKIAGYLFIIGTVIFSGSLYVLALTGVRTLGAVTPVGGVCFLAGWAFAAVAAYRGER